MSVAFGCRPYNRVSRGYMCTSSQFLRRCTTYNRLRRVSRRYFFGREMLQVDSLRREVAGLGPKSIKGTGFGFRGKGSKTLHRKEVAYREEFLYVSWQRWAGYTLLLAEEEIARGEAICTNPSRSRPPTLVEFYKPHPIPLRRRVFCRYKPHPTPLRHEVSLQRGRGGANGGSG